MTREEFSTRQNPDKKVNWKVIKWGYVAVYTALLAGLYVEDLARSKTYIAVLIFNFLVFASEILKDRK